MCLLYHHLISSPISLLQNVFLLGGLVVECWSAALKAGVQTPDAREPKNFRYRLSSADTQQPVDRMGHKTRSTLYSVFYAEASKKTLDIPE